MSIILPSPLQIRCALAALRERNREIGAAVLTTSCVLAELAGEITRPTPLDRLVSLIELADLGMATCVVELNQARSALGEVRRLIEPIVEPVCRHCGAAYPIASGYSHA